MGAAGAVLVASLLTVTGLAIVNRER